MKKSVQVYHDCGLLAKFCNLMYYIVLMCALCVTLPANYLFSLTLPDTTFLINFACLFQMIGSFLMLVSAIKINDIDPPPHLQYASSTVQTLVKFKSLWTILLPQTLIVLSNVVNLGLFVRKMFDLTGVGIFMLSASVLCFLIGIGFSILLLSIRVKVSDQLLSVLQQKQQFEK